VVSFAKGYGLSIKGFRYMIPFTRRELNNAFKANYNASLPTESTTSNAQRLLLFYAIECGLKAAILKQTRRSITVEMPSIGEAGHDLKKLMKQLKIDGQFKLPRELKLNDVSLKTRAPKTQRKAPFKDLNQIWRYGGRCIKIDNFHNDAEIEVILKKIYNWIKGELI